ncbi:MAG: translation initiation factor IF-3 [Pseudomonadota bacterium]|nr:MAG: translation initiation factor IF-3 [Pseudomonadota bacterium]
MRDARTNRRIRAREVRLIGADGTQLGIVPLEVALEKAQEEGLDLVEISPNARPPVCKIMDYGKYKYEAKKKAAEARKRQVVVQVKEIKLRPKTDEHDYGVKVRNVRRFLEDGNKARVTIMFRGREIAHKEIGQKLLQNVAEDVKDVGVIEQAPRLEGRQMFMVLAPNPKIRAQLREQKGTETRPAPSQNPGRDGESAPAAE